MDFLSIYYSIFPLQVITANTSWSYFNLKITYFEFHKKLIYVQLILVTNWKPSGAIVAFGFFFFKYHFVGAFRQQKELNLYFHCSTRTDCGHPWGSSFSIFADLQPFICPIIVRIEAFLFSFSLSSVNSSNLKLDATSKRKTSTIGG